MNNSEFSKSLQNILKNAKKQALKTDAQYVDLCHLMYPMINDKESNVYKIHVEKL